LLKKTKAPDRHHISNALSLASLAFSLSSSTHLLGLGTPPARNATASR
jgi:hypothetical protein